MKTLITTIALLSITLLSGCVNTTNHKYDVDRKLYDLAGRQNVEHARCHQANLNTSAIYIRITVKSASICSRRGN